MLKKIVREKVNVSGKKYTQILTESFREFMKKKIGRLDSFASFAYLYNEYGEPTFNNSDEYKILYDYWFKFEDLVITIHASYHEFVYFGLFIPLKRYNVFAKSEKKTWRVIFNKYPDVPFMPYAMLPFGGDKILTKKQNTENWKRIGREYEKHFTKEQQTEIEEKLKKGEGFDLLEPFAKKLCGDFRSKITKKELKIFTRAGLPRLNQIAGLEEQAGKVANILLTESYIRDVRINIKGYESKKNKIIESTEEGK
jgi:hypothetical protein